MPSSPIAAPRAAATPATRRSPTAWHRDPQIVRLCSNLSWLLVAPCLIRVAVQLPLYLAGRNNVYDTDALIAALGVSKIVMGWPLQLAALAAMVWLLARNHTPIDPTEPEPKLSDRAV